VSLQRYLFLLIGALILVFAGIQYVFIEQVRQQVNDEIASKTRTLSQLALDTVSERFPLTTVTETRQQNEQERARFTATQSVIIKIENTPHKQIKLDNNLTMVTGGQTKTITIERANIPIYNEALLNELRGNQPDGQAFTGEIKGLLINRSDDAYTVDFNFTDNQQDFRKIVRFDAKASSVDQHFRQLHWQLLGFTCTGLLFAFFLAQHVSKPLSRLSQGFADLGKGQLGVQLPETGVKEMRDTLAIFNQTSERLNQLQALEKSYLQQQQMAELGEVARGLAHTLRNPLNTIGLGISQMQQDSLSHEQKALIGKQIQEKIHHIDGTIKTLMHLASSDIDRSHELNVVSVISDVLLEVSVTTQARVMFKSQQQNEPVYLRCAEAEIRATSHALISNAIEANSGQDEQHPVKIELEQTETGICLTIRDYGKGISEQSADRLFKPHFTTKADGAGMGLFIVKRISEMYYKGHVQIINHAEGGCLAILELKHAEALKDNSEQDL
jgi:signal transduction histidine kinase